MKKVVSIENIKLDNPLFIKESFPINNVRASVFRTLGGGVVVYESVKRENDNYITLQSSDTGWIKEETLESIRAIADNVGVRTYIVLEDGTSINVRFAYEKGEVIQAEPIFDGSPWHKVEIKLCKVVL